MKRGKSIRGFTLLEVLTAMAIVALMIGLLIPAIGTIKDTAGTVKQKAQFHAIEIALEAFRADTGDYPPSDYTKTTGVGPGAHNTGYCGAQKLAEAIVGWDGFGYHPKSQWRSDGTVINVTGKDGTSIAGPISLYHVGTDIANFETSDENLKKRHSPYLELERANAVKLNNLYPAASGLHGQLQTNSYVLCDMFGTVKNLATGRRAGMPVLYFRADEGRAFWRPDPLGTNPWNTGTTQDSIYRVNENFPFLANTPPWGNILHPMAAVSGRLLFYDRIRNPNYAGTAPDFKDARPYRAQSFILFSAGPDGLYGTADDVYNVDENEK